MRGTSVLLATVALCAFATVALAQSPDLDAIKRQAKAGQFEAAWSRLEQLPPSAETLRAAIDISASAGRLDLAFSSYERLQSATGRPDLPALAHISRTVLERDRHDDEPLARVESCRALLRAGTQACRADLQQAANDAALDVRVRLTAAAALAETDRLGLALLQRVVDGVAPQRQAIVADVVGRLSATIAVPILSRLLESQVPDVAILSATVLGEFDTPGARSALKGVIGRRVPSPARAAARMSLARLGDSEQIRVMAAVADQLDGADLYRLGSALDAAGDARGMRMLQQALAANDAMVRVDAAAAIARRSTDKAYPVIEEAMTTGDLFVRAHALDVAGRLGWLPSTRMWKLLRDANGVVRARTAAICLQAATAGQTKG